MCSFLKFLLPLSLLTSCVLDTDVELNSKSDSDSDLDTHVAAIKNGNRVTEAMNAENYVASSVRVRIGGHNCSGIKIRRDRILTAAHCAKHLPYEDPRIGLSNRIDGSFLGAGAYTRVPIRHVYIAPYYLSTGGYSYDVAVLELDEMTPGIPSFHYRERDPTLAPNPIDPKFVPAGEYGRLVAYGCGGTKRWADFRAETFSALSEIYIDARRAYESVILGKNEVANGCSGDSGGGFFQQSGNGWRLLGIMTKFDGDDSTGFLRLSEHRGWVMHPDRINKFVHNATGFFNSAFSGRCIGPESISEGVVVREYSCDIRHEKDYRHWRVKAMGQGRFQFQNRHTNKCLSSKTSGQVTQYACGNYAAQRWTPLRTKNGFMFRSDATQKCMKVARSSQNTILVMEDCKEDRVDMSNQFSFNP